MTVIAGLEPEELPVVAPVVSTLLLLPFLTVPPTAPPTTAPMTTMTMTKTVITPLRLRQNDVRDLGWAGARVRELNFSPEPASAMPGVKGAGTDGGWGICGGGLRTEGVRRGGCSRRSTLYPSYMILESCERQSEVGLQMSKRRREAVFSHLQLCTSRPRYRVKQVLVVGRHWRLGWPSRL